MGTAAAEGGFTQVLDARRARDIRTRVDENGTSVGLIVGGTFNRWIGAEMLAAFATNHYLAELRDLASPVATLDNNLFTFFLGNAVIHLASGRVVPFVSAGAGVAGTVDNADLAYNYGGGVKLFLTRRLALRVDARQFLQDVTATLDQVELVGRELVEFPTPYGERISLTTLNVGVTFLLGGR